MGVFALCFSNYFSGMAAIFWKRDDSSREIVQHGVRGRRGRWRGVNYQTVSD